jgi:nitrous oxidase accessory protein NosD
VGDALAQAGPGDTVLLSPGVHRGPIVTGRAGTAAAPIRITGPGATLTGDGDGRLVEIHHSHVVLEGLTVTDADILVWVENATGVRIVGNTLTGAGSECVRVKYRSSANEIAHNRIEGCGLTDFDLTRADKNGEGIYIGTAPEQLAKNPTPDPDRSDHNWVHHNRISARAECVDIKEAATGNRVEANVCTGGLDPDGAGYSSRGLGSIFVGNTATGLVGAGIRLGGDTDQDGTGSEVRANVLTGNGGYGLKVQRFPQGPLCGNEVTGNQRGATNGEVDPAIPC